MAALRQSNKLGEAGFVFFIHHIAVVVESVEEPPALIQIRTANGNLNQLDGGCRIKKPGNKDNEFVRGRWGIMELLVVPPIFLTAPVMHAKISRQFRDMIKAMERRKALRTGKQARARGFL